MKKKILIVDDSATARTLLGICFNDKPEFEVHFAKNWQEAMSQAQDLEPFVIFLDYNMPEKTGTEIARMIQDEGISSHYILVTANTQQSVLNEAKNLNFFDVLEKPISAQQVQTLLEKL